MFDNAPLLVSFGPTIDRMFITALALIIFVYGTTAVLWIYTEIQKVVKWVRIRWFGLKPDDPHFETLAQQVKLHTPNVKAEDGDPV